MTQTMVERFNVAGATLGKLFGRPRDSSDEFARRAAEVRDIGVVTSMYAGIFRVSLTLESRRSRSPWSMAWAVASRSAARSASARWWR